MQGTTGQLFSIQDDMEGVILQVGDISGEPILQVNSNGGIYINSSTNYGLTSNSTIYSIDSSGGNAFYFDYSVSEISTGGMRAGTIICISDGSNVEFTDTSTADLISSTNEISFDIGISGSNILLYSLISSGEWDVRVASRTIGYI